MHDLVWGYVFVLQNEIGLQLPQREPEIAMHAFTNLIC